MCEEDLIELRSRMSWLVGSERLGIMLGILPLGMNSLVASRKMRLSVASPVLHDVGASLEEKRSSV